MAIKAGGRRLEAGGERQKRGEVRGTRLNKDKDLLIGHALTMLSTGMHIKAFGKKEFFRKSSSSSSSRRPYKLVYSFYA
jgi:hypothetical protein